MTYNPMTKEDKAYLQSRGFIKETKEAQTKQKPVAWSLVWRFGGRDQIIKARGSYALCKGIENRKSKLQQYKAGKFVITPLFK